MHVVRVRGGGGALEPVFTEGENIQGRVEPRHARTKGRKIKKTPCFQRLATMGRLGGHVSRRRTLAIRLRPRRRANRWKPSRRSLRREKGTFFWFFSTSKRLDDPMVPKNQRTIKRTNPTSLWCEVRAGCETGLQFCDAFDLVVQSRTAL